MGSLSFDNFHAKKKKIMVELVKAKESAIQLQTLLLEPVQDRKPVSAQQLAFQIYRSFSDAISELNSCTGPTGSDRIPAVEGGASACSAVSKKKKPGVKDRRGCYKRRRNSDSWVIISPTMEDGCAWRKYGQKRILNSDNPRSYFRCTHRQDGCKALKQVQRVTGDKMLYETTYFNHHTCKETLRAPSPLLVESDPIDPNLISFQTRISESKQDGNDQSNDSSKPMILSSVKREHSLSEDVSTLEDLWHDITGLEYKPVWAPYQDEVVESDSLRGLHMEDNQLQALF